MYFRITGSVEKKVIGLFPQSIESNPRGNIREYSLGEINGDELKLPTLKLRNTSKFTDLISSSEINQLQFLIASKELSEVLKNNRNADFESFRITINKGQVNKDCYDILYLKDSMHDQVVRYDKSEYYIGELLDYRYVGEEVKIVGGKDYVNEKSRLLADRKIIKCSSLVLDFRDIDLDIFRLQNTLIANGYYISEKLKNKIEELGFNGIRYTKVTELKEIITALV